MGDLEMLVDDPEAIMPEDWDDDMDGEYVPAQVDNPACAGIGCGVWEAPMISNPEYKGKWKAENIKNVGYSGVWKARMIANPDYFEDLTPFASVVNVKASAVEVWTMSKDIMFDNFYLGNSVSDADMIAAATFSKKQEQAKLNEPSLVEKTKKRTEENKLVVYIMSALAGIPLLYLLYRMIFGSKKVEEEKEEEEEKQPEPEFDMVDDVVADDEGEVEEKNVEKVRKRALNSVLETQSPRNLRNKMEAPIFKPTLILRTNRNQNLRDHDDEPTDEKPINFVIL